MWGWIFNILFIVWVIALIYFFMKRPLVYLSVIAVCMLLAFVIMVGFAGFGYALSWPNFWCWFALVYFWENLQASMIPIGSNEKSFTWMFKQLEGRCLESQRKYAEQQRQSRQV